MKRIVLVTVIAVVVGCWGLRSIASAQQGPCADDTKKFCKDVKPGGGRIIKCLEEHKSELSDACKKHLESGQSRIQGREHLQQAGAACKSDIDKFCKDIAPGGGRIMKCLKEHQAELSDACKTHVESSPSRVQGREHYLQQAGAACKSDIDKFCKDMAPGGGRIMKCLKEHQADLSDACKTHVGK